MRIGELVSNDRIKSGLPPVVLHVQPTGYVEVTKPEELKEFEQNILELYGIRVDAKAVQTMCETCSCCTDDCGYVNR